MQALVGYSAWFDICTNHDYLLLNLENWLLVLSWFSPGRVEGYRRHVDHALHVVVRVLQLPIRVPGVSILIFR